jgi:hypothetical protein
MGLRLERDQFVMICKTGVKSINTDFLSCCDVKFWNDSPHNDAKSLKGCKYHLHDVTANKELVCNFCKTGSLIE